MRRRAPAPVLDGMNQTALESRIGGRRSWLASTAVGAALATLPACGTSGDAASRQTSSADTANIVSMQECPRDNSDPNCPAGDFSVLCADGTQEVDTPAQVDNNQACPENPAAPDGGGGDAGTEGDAASEGSPATPARGPCVRSATAPPWDTGAFSDQFCGGATPAAYVCNFYTVSESPYVADCTCGITGDGSDPIATCCCPY